MPRMLLRGLVVAALIGALAAVAGALAQNVDPLGQGKKYAWGENVGWINAAPNASGNPGVHVTGKDITGYFWGENIGWINLSCLNNATCGTTGNYGVRNNGLGKLSGYAWGENVGWISFSCNNAPVTCATTGGYGVSINPATGEWSGAAWGENIGWINFSHSQTASRIVSDDLDSIAFPPDNCPFDYNPGQEDADSDNLGDACEAAFGTDPNNPDTDGDGCRDGREVGLNQALGGLRNPLSPWDFFDVPVPALNVSSPSSPRNLVITLGDALAILAYVGTSSGGSPNANGLSYDSDWNGNGVNDGAEYDRTPPVDVSMPWRSGPPNGLVSLGDVLVVLHQVGHSCA